MGNYINRLPDGEILGAHGKGAKIAAMPESVEIKFMPSKLDAVPDGRILVTVVTNTLFEAALICDNEHDFNCVEDSVVYGLDPRPCRYFYLPRDLVRKMADEELYSERKT